MRNPLSLAAAIVLCVACVTPPRAPPSSRSGLLGREVPEFRRPTVQGGAVSTEALRGRVWVIEFFASWCKPCVPRLAAAQRLRAEFPDVEVVGISVDESHVEALKQVLRHRLQFPVVHDEGNVLSSRLRVSTLPTAIVIARDGRVAWVGGPEQEEHTLRLAVRALREERPPTTR